MLATVGRALSRPSSAVARPLLLGALRGHCQVPCGIFDDPVTCINEECGVEWTPEPVLKSKQPVAFDDDKDDKKKKDDSDLSDDDDDLDIDEDEETNPDDEVDLGGDDDIAVDTGKDDKEDDS